MCPEVSFCVQSSEIQQENVHTAQSHGSPDLPRFLLMLMPAAVSHAECPGGSCVNPHRMKNFSLHGTSICRGLTDVVMLTVGLPKHGSTASKPRNFWMLYILWLWRFFGCFLFCFSWFFFFFLILMVYKVCHRKWERLYSGLTENTCKGGNGYYCMICMDHLYGCHSFLVPVFAFWFLLKKGRGQNVRREELEGTMPLTGGDAVLSGAG